MIDIYSHKHLCIFTHNLSFYCLFQIQEQVTDTKKKRQRQHQAAATHSSQGSVDPDQPPEETEPREETVPEDPASPGAGGAPDDDLTPPMQPLHAQRRRRLQQRNDQRELEDCRERQARRVGDAAALLHATQTLIQNHQGDMYLRALANSWYENLCALPRAYQMEAENQIQQILTTLRHRAFRDASWLPRVMIPPELPADLFTRDDPPATQRKFPIFLFILA